MKLNPIGAEVYSDKAISVEKYSRILVKKGVLKNFRKEQEKSNSRDQILLDL